MTTIKLGSKGEDVKTLQKALNLTADGIFGPKTEAAVKSFQTKNGLGADGIVGPKTWAKLLPSSSTTNSKCVDPSVIYDPLDVHVSKLPGRSIKYLAIHYTGSSNSKPGRAKATKKTFESRQASADFCVDDRDMVQFNPDLNNYYCWSVGDKKYGGNNKGGSLYGKATNRNTISIEVCSTCTPATSEAVAHGNHAGWSFTDATLANAEKLAKILMKKFNIDKDHVVRHYDISGKSCPGIIGWNNELILTTAGKSTGKYSDSSKWIAFKNRL